MDIIPNPMNILKTSHDLLAKNGIIAINVPNYESVSTDSSNVILKNLIDILEMILCEHIA